MTRLIGPQCVKGPECHPGWPARAAHTHGVCVQCWMGLSAGERAGLRWDADAERVAGAGASGSVDALELIALLPVREHPEAA